MVAFIEGTLTRTRLVAMEFTHGRTGFSMKVTGRVTRSTVEGILGGSMGHESTVVILKMMSDTVRVLMFGSSAPNPIEAHGAMARRMG